MKCLLHTSLLTNTTNVTNTTNTTNLANVIFNLTMMAPTTVEELGTYGIINIVGQRNKDTQQNNQIRNILKWYRRD